MFHIDLHGDLHGCEYIYGLNVILKDIDKSKTAELN